MTFKSAELGLIVKLLKGRREEIASVGQVWSKFRIDCSTEEEKNSQVYLLSFVYGLTSQSIPSGVLVLLVLAYEVG